MKSEEGQTVASLHVKRVALIFALGVASAFGWPAASAEESIRNAVGLDAAKSAIYGMVANNAFKESSRPHFILPGNWKRVKQVDDEYSGLHFDLYEVSGASFSNMVIAFRGSDSEADQPATSKKQYELVDKVMPGIIRDYPSAKIIAVGHSLGGGLALHTSLVFDGIDAFAFNPSPRVFREGQNKPNKRYMINEKGDPLNKVRAIWKEVPGVEEWEFDFSVAGEKEHSSYPLALGLLLLGSTASNDLSALMHRNCESTLFDDCKKMTDRVQRKYKVEIN